MGENDDLEPEPLKVCFEVPEGFGSEIEFMAVLKGVVERYGPDVSPEGLRAGVRWFSQYAENYARAVEELS